MRRGRLRCLVTVFTVTDTRAADGTVSQAETSAWDTYAAIEPLRGAERSAVQQVQSDATYKITMPYRAGLTSKHRIRYGTRVFDIRSPAINVNERNRYVEVECREVE